VARSYWLQQLILNEETKWETAMMRPGKFQIFAVPRNQKYDQTWFGTTPVYKIVAGRNLVPKLVDGFPHYHPIIYIVLCYR
jgi:hypothetical protein